MPESSLIVGKRGIVSPGNHRFSALISESPIVCRSGQIPNRCRINKPEQDFRITARPPIVFSIEKRMC